MSTAEYDALPVEDKYQALMRYAICDREDAASAGGFESGATELTCSVAGLDGVRMEDGSVVAEKNGRIILSFDAPEDSEIYLMIEGLKIENVEKRTEGHIIVRAGGRAGEATIPNPLSNFYFPKENYAFCLGDGETQSCEIEFTNALNYTFDAIRLVSLPLSDYREAAQARRAEGMENVSLSNNRITGDITVSGERVLQIAVPYSEGWSAWADGEAAEVFRCGGLYMGVALEAGKHTIEMRYTTPGLVQGVGITLAAALVFMALVIGGRMRARRRKERKQA